MRALRSTLAAAAIFAVLAGPVAAQNSATPEPQPRPKLGVGFQSSWPAYGISGIYDVNPQVSGQAVLGFLGGWTTVSGRGLYRFAQRPFLDPYGFGSVGMWRYDSGFADASAVSFGGGGGIDFDLRRLGPDIPPLYLNMELGLSIMNMELAGYTGAWMAFGAGMHYRF
jgi:hypothetical protein